MGQMQRARVAVRRAAALELLSRNAESADRLKELLLYPEMLRSLFGTEETLRRTLLAQKRAIEKMIALIDEKEES